MIDITKIILHKLDTSEHKFYFDEDIKNEFGTYQLIGTLEVVLFTQWTGYSHLYPMEIKKQYVLNILNDLILYDANQNEIDYKFDEKQIEQVFEI